MLVDSSSVAACAARAPMLLSDVGLGHGGPTGHVVAMHLGVAGAAGQRKGFGASRPQGPVEAAGASMAPDGPNGSLAVLAACLDGLSSSSFAPGTVSAVMASRLHSFSSRRSAEGARREAGRSGPSMARPAPSQGPGSDPYG